MKLYKRVHCPHCECSKTKDHIEGFGCLACHQLGYVYVEVTPAELAAEGLRYKAVVEGIKLFLVGGIEYFNALAKETHPLDTASRKLHEECAHRYKVALDKLADLESKLLGKPSEKEGEPVVREFAGKIARAMKEMERLIGVKLRRYWMT